MQELVRVAVDAMGGDNAPLEIVKGAVEALELRKDLKVILVGPEETARAELSFRNIPMMSQDWRL